MQSFQCSSASRKFLNRPGTDEIRPGRHVSVLFSEPKIPQSAGAGGGSRVERKFQCSSASRKFLNSYRVGIRMRHKFRFSALQRAENSSIYAEQQSDSNPYSNRFSALQRAENSSIPIPTVHKHLILKFQCSSASRKFLNRATAPVQPVDSIVSVLFSEPKIPQLTSLLGLATRAPNVSVLFSEPKIPQSFKIALIPQSGLCFSALQRAENSSISCNCSQQWGLRKFQCSSASRKFLN